MQDVRPCPVAAEGAFEGFIDLLLVAALFHVYQIEHHKAADIAQTQLAGDFLDRFEVHFENRRLLRTRPAVMARVDIDGDQCLRLVYDEIPAAFEGDFAAEGLIALMSPVFTSMTIATPV